MSLFRKYLTLLLFAILMATSIQAQQQEKVTLQLKWKHQFQFAGYYAAIEKGFYNEVGIQVKLIEAEEGKNPSDAVFDGKAQFGVCTSDILLMRAQHKKAVVLATIFQHSPQILLASKQSGIKHVQDLAGKRIAMEPNAADIVAFMNDEGITLDQCIIDQHNFNVDELIRGEVDAISAYLTDEPFVLKEADFDYTIITPAMGGIDFYGDVLFTTETLINDKPELVKKFRQASLKGWKYAMDHPDELVEIIYNNYTQRHSKAHLMFEAEKMKSLIMAQVVEIGYNNPGRWESISDTYKKLKMVDSSFSTVGMLYSDYLNPEFIIPWKLIFIFVLIIIIIGSIAYFFYSTSRKLKNENIRRKKLEKEFHESEKKYHILYLDSPDAYLIIVDGIFVDCNRTTEQMMRTDRNQIIGKSPDFLSPEFQPDGKKSSEAAVAKIKYAQEHGRNTFEWVHRRFDGTEFMVEVSIAAMNLEGKQALFTTWRDITERKNAEEKLRESEEKFREMADLLPQIVFETDIKGKLTYVNKQAIGILRYPEDVDVLSINTIDLYIPEDRLRAAENIRRRMSGELEGNFEYTMRRYDGSLMNVLVYSNSIIRNAKLIGLRGIIIDITERKQAEYQINRKNEELQKLNAEKDKFFSIIAHDLKSPFNGIMGFSELLAERIKEKDYDGIRKYAEIIQQSTERVLELLMNLMEWARSQTGRMEFSPEFFDMVTLINKITPLFEDIASQKLITIHRILPANAPVFADKAMVSTILRNLISNAIKFTHPEGEIKINVEESQKDLIVSIRDNGVGIPKNSIEKLFRIDENHSTPGTQNEQGTGLGLILCKEFVEKHGGTIWVESDPDGISGEKGSTFYFTIPNNTI